MKLLKLYENYIQENTYRVYHGSNSNFRKFDLKKTAQGIAWFSSSIDSIKNGDAGAQGTKYIIPFDITITKPAGWDEYDKYGLGELQQMRYDGIILPHEDGTASYVVFDTKNIKKATIR